jgi:hypothetical protein
MERNAQGPHWYSIVVVLAKRFIRISLTLYFLLQGDVSNATDNARNRSSGMPVKVRRSSRLSGVDKLKEETDGISHFHENLSIELAKDLSEEPKSKRRRVETRRSSGSSCFGDETDHHTTTFDMNVSSPFDCSKYTLGFSRHDKSTRGDVLQAPEYVCDIFQRLFKIEVSDS